VTFSISDAYNEAGEPIMSPEQIRAEMQANEDRDAFYCDMCGGRHTPAFDCDNYDPGEED
jgi:hypothetical protein